MTDPDIISLVKSGDLNAYSEIVERHKSRIASTIFGIVGECQEAEDIGQEVFIRFYKSINNFRGEAQLITYLTRIAINLSLNELKRRKRRKMFSYESWFDNSKNEADVAGSVNNYEKKEIIYYALDKLEPKYRAVLTLRLIDGFSTEETADILKLPVGTVLSRLSRAQKKIKQILIPILEG